MLPKSRALLLVAALSVGLSACATAAKKAGVDTINEDDWVNPVQEYDEGNGFRKVTLDINSDQRADVFNYYRVGEGVEDKLLVRKEIDLNFDGTVDVSQIWKEGEMTQEQIDADFDGRNDWIDFYDQGERIRAEWDTSFDGRPDLIRYYEGGKIARVEMDTTGDRQIDYWEYYEAGIMQRSGWDLNADGKVDKWGEN
jgi:antitoxin component YwqK of YwqJK toxin-antitoxin module